MDSCKICRAPITGEYFRIATEMCCSLCAGKIIEKASESKSSNRLRGILFAFLGACAAGLMRWLFELMFVGQTNYGFINLFAAFLRYFVFIAMAGIIGASAKAGSRQEGGLWLQIPTAIFTYLAFAFFYIPLIFKMNPKLPFNSSAVWAISLLALRLPFTSVLRDIFNVTGLILIVICMVAVWNMTGKKETQVDGPFDVTVRDSERPMFAGIG